MIAESPILMEHYFTPGLPEKPMVHIGSQTMDFFDGDPKEQSYEVRHLAATKPGDVIALRSVDSAYLDYWQSLIGGVHVVTAPENPQRPGQFLTDLVAQNPKVLDQIGQKMHKDSRLMVFLPTMAEQKLADKLGIKLHGTPQISDEFGTKSGIRKLAVASDIPMSPGFICESRADIEEAIKSLGPTFSEMALKHDLSTGGGWSKKISAVIGQDELTAVLNEVSNGTYHGAHDPIVVEGWLTGNASLCAHIEILEGGPPIVCAGWGQRIDTDGITYLGAAPLNLSPKAFASYFNQAHQLANVLHENGAVGSYSPDFLITSPDSTNYEPDTSVVLELNARVPATAFPLEIIKQVRGWVGNGFSSTHIKLDREWSSTEILTALNESGLLITKKDSQARGVVPYNVGLLPWKVFDVAVMAQDWQEVEVILKQVEQVFQGN